MSQYELLGQFYLGKRYDLGQRARMDDLVLYDAKDLVTHAVCVGMTGSGKTGLCVGLLEEAAIDGVPALIIDPKGDLTNLLLTFPELRPADFRPWINEDDARKKGLSPDEFAGGQAALWSKGLSDWHQSGERIRALRAAAEMAIYTPGSSAGRPLSVLKSLDPPPAAVLSDAELLRERVAGTATSLLGLLGVDADPVRSREHVLISTLLGRAWSAGQGLDMGQLIAQIQTPPVQRVGVMELESFFPSKDRFGLAMALNGLLAAPGFAAWTEGEPLDVQRLLYTPEGRPRLAICSIAHLSDAERMFFVSLLLNQVVAWTRTQSGTSSLRAIVYMDEIAGYVPPVANPPSKAPILTLMKQARAFGVGVVLVTQNPVDLDYKGLANAGTWLIGRLQTDRDKQRVLDGLEGAAATAGSGFERAEYDRLLSALGPRVFLMHNVHDPAPTVFETRWAMSYLRGPLTRDQIRTLCRPAPAPPAAQSAVAAAPIPGPLAPASGSAPAGRPVLPAEVPQFFLRYEGPGVPSYRPMLVGMARAYFADAKLGVDTSIEYALLTPLTQGAVAADWEHAEDADLEDADLLREPTAAGGTFDPLPPEAAKPKSYDAWRRGFADAIARGKTLELRRSTSLEEVSRVGEKEGDFRARLVMLARERRDAFAERLRGKYAGKLATLNDRLRRANQNVEVQKAQARDAKLSSVLSFGSALLGAFMGRKVIGAGTVSRASTAMRGASRSARESGDVGRAEENAEAIAEQIKDLESQIEAEIAVQAQTVDPLREELEVISIKPKKTGVQIRVVGLVWVPA